MIVAFYAIHGKNDTKMVKYGAWLYFLDEDEVNKFDADADGDISARRFSASNCFAALLSLPPPSPAGAVCFFAWPNSVERHFEAKFNEQTVSPKLYTAGEILTNISTLELPPNES